MKRIIIFGNDQEKKISLINSISGLTRVNKLCDISNYFYIVDKNFFSYPNIISKYENLNFIFVANNIYEIPFSIRVIADKIFPCFLEERIEVKSISSIFLSDSISFFKNFFKLPK